jgi:hypothetical protein
VLLHETTFYEWVVLVSNKKAIPAEQEASLFPHGPEEGSKT